MDIFETLKGTDYLMLTNNLLVESVIDLDSVKMFCLAISLWFYRYYMTYKVENGSYPCVLHKRKCCSLQIITIMKLGEVTVNNNTI